MRYITKVFCNVGDSLYTINNFSVVRLTVVAVNHEEVYYEVLAVDDVGTMHSYYAEDFGKTVFSSEFSARSVLKRMHQSSR